MWIYFVVLGLFYLWYLWTRYPKGFPPHLPLSLPIVGDALAFLCLGSPTEAFTKLRRRYGDAFGFIIGPQRLVVLCGYDLVMEAGTREELIGRELPPSQAEFRGSKDPYDSNQTPGVVGSQGTIWQEQRRFCLQALKDLGMGRNGIEVFIHEEAKELCTYLEASKTEAVDIRNKVNIMVVNALWRIATSERLKHDDPKLSRIIVMIDEFFQEITNPIAGMLGNNKVLYWIAINLRLFVFGKVFGELSALMKKSIEPLRRTYQPDSLRNFTDYYFKMVEQQEATREQKSFLGQEGELNLINVLSDLFLAGSETTSTTLNWVFLYMILNPDIQERVHEELDNVIGKGILPRSEDRIKTPYIEAVLHEGQRMGNIVDRSVPHGAIADCYLSTGHFIPKGTVILPWLGSVMFDPEVFPEPYKFDPNRYLDEHGKTFKPHPRVIPFGVGKRRCLGELLAKMELYVFFTAVMTHFRLEKASPDDQPSTQAIEGAIFSPKPYKLRFIPRL